MNTETFFIQIDVLNSGYRPSVSSVLIIPFSSIPSDYIFVCISKDFLYVAVYKLTELHRQRRMRDLTKTHFYKRISLNSRLLVL